MQTNEDVSNTHVYAEASQEIPERPPSGTLHKHAPLRENYLRGCTKLLTYTFFQSQGIDALQEGTHGVESFCLMKDLSQPIFTDGLLPCAKVHAGISVSPRHLTWSHAITPIKGKAQHQRRLVLRPSPAKKLCL
jgi:hypothetical protein